MAAHWVNDASMQVTIYTCMAHVGTSSGSVKQAFAVISDSTAHSSIEADIFNRKIFQHISQSFGMKQLHIWSDGAAQHFKNYKTMGLFSFHPTEFNLEYVDWNLQVCFN
jgi:homospermidine synthase